eukprot:3880979-Amphidinium_carterae.1
MTVRYITNAARMPYACVGGPTVCLVDTLCEELLWWWSFRSTEGESPNTFESFPMQQQMRTAAYTCRELERAVSHTHVHFP